MRNRKSSNPALSPFHLLAGGLFALTLIVAAAAAQAAGKDIVLSPTARGVEVLKGPPHVFAPAAVEAPAPWRPMPLGGGWLLDEQNQRYGRCNVFNMGPLWNWSETEIRCVWHDLPLR